VPDEENDGIDQYFEEVNKFIEGARRCSKKVLIYSYEGKSRAALFAVQYLMSYEGLLLRQAYNMVKKQRPQVSLNPSFQKALERLEKTLFPDEKHSVNICNEYLNVADPQAIKCAWIDC
jgi:protein-tyrosine phosphatase